MLRIIGIALVLSGAGGFGVGKMVQFYRQMRQLQEFRNALEIIKCEMNYTLSPLPKLCRTTAKRVSGAASSFLLAYADALDKGISRTKAAQTAMEQTKSLCLPKDATMAILELFGSLGRYELEGENRLLRLTAHRLNAAIARYESEKKPLAKGYAILGFCTGLAIVILIV